MTNIQRAITALWGVAMILPSHPIRGQQAAPQKLRVYVGTYTGAKSKASMFPRWIWRPAPWSQRD